MSKFIREDLKKFIPYKPNQKKYTYKMDANESPFNLIPEVREEFINWFKDKENLNIYPETNSDTLRESIGEFYNIDKENIVCGVGSDELIDCIIKTFLEVGETVIINTPTFDMYEIFTTINRGKVLDIPLKEDYTFDVDKIIESANKVKAKIIFICTPNNPTGTIISNEDIKKIANNVNSIIVVDEAYAEFSNQSIISDINSFNNLIVLRTFSKAFGLAGARVGYAISNLELINDINIVKPPFNLSTISQKLATLCLKYSEKYIERIEYLKSERDRIIKVLDENKDLTVYNSKANFIYIKSKIPIVEKAYEKGILLRKYPDKDGLEIVRITVNTIIENDMIIDIIKSL